jgi:hypothetical protein
MRNNNSMSLFLVLISFMMTTQRHYYYEHHHHATLPQHSTTMVRMVRISNDYNGRKTKRQTATPVAVCCCHSFCELVPPPSLLSSSDTDLGASSPTVMWQPNDDDCPSSLFTNGDEDPPSPITCMQ